MECRNGWGPDAARPASEPRKFSEPRRPLNSHTALPPSEQARIRLLAARLHALGPRPLAEYLTEILRGADARARLERYAALDPNFIAALGGDRLLPPRIVSGDR
jgi:hypothetical protein